MYSRYLIYNNLVIVQCWLCSDEILIFKHWPCYGYYEYAFVGMQGKYISELCLISLPFQCSLDKSFEEVLRSSVNKIYVHFTINFHCKVYKPQTKRLQFFLAVRDNAA